MARRNQQQKRKPQKSNLVLEARQVDTHLSIQPDSRKKFTQHDIKNVKPLTDNQLTAFQEWGQGQNLVLEGYAGTGKSFLALYMALNTILDPRSEQDKIVIVRSQTPTKDIGFLPGDLDEKQQVYETPYMQICDQLFCWRNSYKNMKEIGLIKFETTSFLRGTSWDDAVIIFDEFQCGTPEEIETVCTRVGEGSRIIICGDSLHQNDIGKKSGGVDALKVLRKMDSVSFINFKLADIVRSGWVREYLMAKYS